MKLAQDSLRILIISKDKLSNLCMKTVD